MFGFFQSTGSYEKPRTFWSERDEYKERDRPDPLDSEGDLDSFNQCNGGIASGWLTLYAQMPVRLETP